MCWTSGKTFSRHEIKAANLLQYITSKKFDDGRWQGTYKDFIIQWCEQVHQYKSLCKDNASHFSEPASQDADVTEHCGQCHWLPNHPHCCSTKRACVQTGHASTSMSPHSFQDYKALLLSAADAYDTKHAARRCPIHNAFYHDLNDLTVAYKYKGHGYDINTDIAIIYANAAKTHACVIPTEQFDQMSLEGCKLWASLSDDDHSLILEQELTSASTLMHTFDHSWGRESGHGCGTFACQHDKQCVSLHDQEPNDMASETVKETTGSTNTHVSVDFNLAGAVCKQFDVNLDTLYIQITRHCTEANSQGEA